MQEKDKLKLIILSSLNEEELSSLFLLYRPVLGEESMYLYQTMYALGKSNTKITNHKYFIQSLKISISAFEAARKQLEQFRLIKTYYHGAQNTYLYQLFAPLKGIELLRHDIFGRLYLQEVGNDVFELMSNSFMKEVEVQKDYQDISEPMSTVLQRWNGCDEDVFESTREYLNGSLTLTSAFQFKKFLTLSKVVFPETLRSEENLMKIGELATLYGVSEVKMKQYVGKSVSLKKGSLDFKKLERLVKENTETKSSKQEQNIYLLPPNVFLKQKQHGIEPIPADKNLILYLFDELKMKPEVINVLIEYVLDINQQKLSKSYVSKVAGSWIRLKIDTYEKALEHINEEKKPKYQTAKKQQVLKNLPEWYTNPEDNIAHNDEEKKQRLLKELAELEDE